jgi:predicted metal-binding transcription factor (methanogenesis marker protein 9)
MDIKNLTDENVTEFKSLADKLKETNPDLMYKTFMQEDDLSNEEYKSLRTQVDELAAIMCETQQMIKNIFGGSVLINGQFVDVSKKI